jgi:hypothetical protein
MQDILSGDPTRVSKALAPQISTMQKQNQQQRNQTAQFAPRSGGNAATVANLGTSGRSDIINLTGALTNSAATNLGSQGAGLLSMGMSGNEAGFDMATQMQAQQAAKWNEIINAIGKTIGSIASLKGVKPGASQDLNALASILT